MIEYYKKYEPLFGDWKISKAIGKGSFSQVYEIERENFGTTYKAALKTIRIPMDEGELNELMSSGMSIAETKQYIKQSAKDIVNEFVLMSKLKGHTNIVSYEDHQVIEHEDKLGWDILMKMELLEPLNHYIKTHDITKKDIVKLGIDLCTALELCEKYNIVHRDIKPENIFVSPNGDFKLGDFGIARTMEKATMGLSKKGTYSYMAPEVYKGENYTLTVDIYSLGIVMYKLMNQNRVPFMPEYPKPIAYSDRENSLIKRMNGEAIPLPANMQNGRLVEIVLKACNYNADERYQNATEMKEALKEVLDEEDNEVVRSQSTHELEMQKLKEKTALNQEGQDDDVEKTVLLDREELTNDEHTTNPLIVQAKQEKQKRIIKGISIAVMTGTILVGGMTLINQANKNSDQQEKILSEEDAKAKDKEIHTETDIDKETVFSEQKQDKDISQKQVGVEKQEIEDKKTQLNQEEIKDVEAVKETKDEKEIKDAKEVKDVEGANKTEQTPSTKVAEKSDTTTKKAAQKNSADSTKAVTASKNHTQNSNKANSQSTKSSEKKSSTQTSQKTNSQSIKQTAPKASTQAEQPATQKTNDTEKQPTQQQVSNKPPEIYLEFEE